MGFNHLSIYDHVLGAVREREPGLWGPCGVDESFHDPFAMLAHLAALTTRLELVT